MPRSTELIASWNADHARYDRLATRVKTMLTEATRKVGLRCEIEARAKDLASFVKKLVRKNYADASKVTDKAGARVICMYDSDRAELRQLVAETFATKDWDDKRLSLDHDRLGYLGLHCQATLRDTTSNPDLAGLECEIQIHTQAEHAWSAPLHDLVYKPPLDVGDRIKRSAYRLLALTEIFDSEVTRVRDEILKMPDFKEAQILASLERDFYRLTGKDFDRQLSFEILRVVSPLYGDQTADAIGVRLAEFVKDNRKKLEDLFTRYTSGTTPEAIFLFQPESIAVFERLEADSYRLKEVADRFFESSYLDSLSLIWGSPVN